MRKKHSSTRLHRYPAVNSTNWIKFKSLFWETSWHKYQYKIVTHSRKFRKIELDQNEQIFLQELRSFHTNAPASEAIEIV